MAVRDMMSTESKSTLCELRTMLNPLAPNAKGALVSMVPNGVKKSQHLRLTPTAVLSNLHTFLQL